MDFGQRNLSTKRFPNEKQEQWIYVCIPNRFRSARWKYTDETRTYSVALVALEKRSGQQGGSNKVEVLHFRSATLDGLKKEIEKSFGNAVFSTEQPKETDPVQAAYQEERNNAPADAKEIADAWEKLRKQYGQRNANGVQELIPGTKFTEEDCRKVGIRRGVYLALSRQAEQDEINLLTNAAREYVAEQTPEQQERLLGTQLQDFVNNGEWGWKQWFAEHRLFFQWPDNKPWWNRNQLLRYCYVHGSGKVPTHLELATGMKYLLERGNFFALKSSYKRSERFEFDELQEYRGDELVAPTFSARQIEEATKQLEALMPAGMRPNQEFVAQAAKQLGISDQLLYIIQHPNEQPKPQLAGESAAELKKDL